jgi:hypothetical protein
LDRAFPDENYINIISIALNRNQYVLTRTMKIVPYRMAHPQCFSGARRDRRLTHYSLKKWHDTPPLRFGRAPGSDLRTPRTGVKVPEPVPFSKGLVAPAPVPLSQSGGMVSMTGGVYQPSGILQDKMTTNRTKWSNEGRLSG